MVPWPMLCGVATKYNHRAYYSNLYPYIDVEFQMLMCRGWSIQLLAPEIINLVKALEVEKNSLGTENLKLPNGSWEEVRKKDDTAP